MIQKHGSFCPLRHSVHCNIMTCPQTEPEQRSCYENRKRQPF